MTLTLQQKLNVYKGLIKTQQDKNGFIEFGTCDSLLFSCLAGCVPGVDVDPWTAYDSHTGRWFRRPLEYAECYASGNSGSSISRDMVLGLLWNAWCKKDLNITESIIKYGLNNMLIMGDGSPTRTLLVPGLLATAAEISYRLGGPNRWYLRELPQYENGGVTDYEAHLSVLHQLLRHKLTGERVKYDHSQVEPENPLFAFAARHDGLAEVQLLNTEYWPEDRLPNSHDRREQWLPQRDFGTDWLPNFSTDLKTFGGGDFIFVAALVLGEI